MALARLWVRTVTSPVPPAANDDPVNPSSMQNRGWLLPHSEYARKPPATSALYGNRTLPSVNATSAYSVVAPANVSASAFSSWLSPSTWFSYASKLSRSGFKSAYTSKTASFAVTSAWDSADSAASSAFVSDSESDSDSDSDSDTLPSSSMLFTVAFTLKCAKVVLPGAGSRIAPVMPLNSKFMWWQRDGGDASSSSLSTGACTAKEITEGCLDTTSSLSLVSSLSDSTVMAVAAVVVSLTMLKGAYASGLHREMLVARPFSTYVPKPYVVCMATGWCGRHVADTFPAVDVTTVSAGYT